VKAAIGAEGVALAREHARRVFVLALEREHARRERKAARHVLRELPAQDLAVVLVARQRDLAHLGAGQRRRGQRRANLLVADLHDILLASVGRLGLRPHVEKLLRGRVELRVTILGQGVDLREQRRVAGRLLGGQRRLGNADLVGRDRLRAAALLQHRQHRAQLLALARDVRLALGPLVIAADRLRDVREIARARRRHDRTLRGGLLAVHRRQDAGLDLQSLGHELGDHGLVQRGNAVVVEARRNRSIHRHLVRRRLERLAIALELLAHVAQRVLGALAVELVDRDEVGEVEHVDLLELACRAELRRHHVKRGVHERHDGRVALADARGLDDHEVEARDLARRDHVRQRLADLASGIARRERAHIDMRVLDRIHANAVAQQRATGLAPRRVDRDDRDVQGIALVEAEAAHELVGQRALARAARAGDAERGRLGLGRGRHELGAQLLRDRPVLEAGDEPRQRVRAFEASSLAQRGQRRGQVLRQIDVAGGDDLVDHALQPEALAVLGREDARHTVVVQLLDLGRHDHTAAAAEHLDVGAAALAQQLDHVLEELDVAALVGRDRDAVRVFLQRAIDDLLDRAVVPEMDHFAAARLQDAAHDVDRRVVTVEQTRRRDEANLVDRLVDERRTGGVVHEVLVSQRREGKLTLTRRGGGLSRDPILRLRKRQSVRGSTDPASAVK
jgi:hypothetical protein